MPNDTVLFLVNPGPRPPLARVADHLWGSDADFDSDGNSSDPSDTNWTELTVQARPDPDDLNRVDVDPVSESPLVLKVVSSSTALAERAAHFLAHYCKAEVVSQWPSPTQR
jgi:hypothetical protein